MEIQVKVTTTYQCSLQRAFKTPMLCDISKVHTGFGLVPKITHCTEDESWGQVGSSKKVHAAKSLLQRGGVVSSDRILERVENSYWKIQVDEFQYWFLGIDRLVGEWKTTELAPRSILIEYTYTLHSGSPSLHLLQWLFAKTIWRIYMKQVVENVRIMAYNSEPYLYP